MTEFTLSVPCLFGLEGLCAQELRRLDMKEVAAENGRVLFKGTFEDIIRANLWLRTGERVLLRLASFPARTFEELFQGVYHTPLEAIIPKNGAFPVKGHCLGSQLHSVPDCQAIVKKAAAKRLGEKYHVGWMPETGSLYQLQFSIMKDQAELFLDTTGAGLHKRGYRAVGNDAPLRETLAAAMVNLARYRGRDNFVDPFCGSGTIAIEAAMIAKNRAPGLNRSFSCQKWDISKPELWQKARSEALDKEFHGDYHIYASDIDPKSLAIAQSNAKKAGMDRIYHLLPGRRHQANAAGGERRDRHQPALRSADDGAASGPAAAAGFWPHSGRSEGLWRLYHFLRGGAGAVLRKALHQKAEAL